MLFPRTTRNFAFLIGIASLTVTAACGDGPTNGNGNGNGNGTNAFVGTWTASSFEADDVELITGGVSMVITFTAGGTYSIVWANDADGVFCDSGTSCTDDGSFALTSNTITFDVDTVDEIIFTYTISGTTLTISGIDDGVTISATFQKTG